MMTTITTTARKIHHPHSSPPSFRLSGGVTAKVGAAVVVDPWGTWAGVQLMLVDEMEELMHLQTWAQALTISQPVSRLER